MQELLLYESRPISYQPVLWLDPSDQPAGSSIITDKSASNLTINNVGVVVSDDAPIDGMKSMYFAGTSWRNLNWASSMGNILAGSFTIEYWFKPEGAGLYDVFAQWRQLAGEAGILIITKVPDTAMNFGPYNDTTALLTTPGIVANTWQHVAYTRAGTAWLCFLNGKLINRTTFAGEKAAMTMNYYIGGYLTSAGAVGTAGHNPMVGKLANFRIYRGAQRLGNFDPYAI